MKVSYNWLKELVDLEGYDFEEITKQIALKMIEIETINKVTSASSIVIGHVIDKKPHPNADKLSVCLVDIGSETLQIVCGAPNVAKGQKVMVAVVSAVLGQLKIKQCELRGVSSNGMICSLSELGLESKYIPQEYLNGIFVLPHDAPIGEDALAYLALNDISIELGLTPNRMDLLSMKGVARDLAVILKRPCYDEYFVLNESNEKVSDELKVTIETPGCISYFAKKVKNVVIQESPNFIKGRLIAAGIRPINNVVDITNYILLLFGQPLHAFDAHKLKGEIVVRSAKENEKVVTLDEQVRYLQKDDVVITDGQEVVCIGGVMGCLNSEVTNETVDVVLEAAVFDKLAVRKTSNRLNLRSESSLRFERGVDVNQTRQALEYACYLLNQYASGDVLKGYVHQGVDQQQPRKIELSVKKVNDYLGLALTKDEIATICEDLGFDVSGSECLEILVPNRRMDITIKEDLIEEIARINGYDKMPQTLPKMSLDGTLTLRQKRIRLIQTVLSELGLNEVITYSLTSPYKNNLFSLNKATKPITLLNPMSEERMVLRKNLVMGLVDVAKYNSARKNKNLALFEIGRTYYEDDDQNPQEAMILTVFLSGEYSSTKWQQKTENVDFYVVKGIMENLFKRLGINVSYQTLTTNEELFHPHMSAQILFQNQVVGIMGAIHPSFVKNNDLMDAYVCEIAIDKILDSNQTVVTYKPLIKTPSVERDLALVVDVNTEVGKMVETIYKTDKKLIRNVSVFDLYVGDKLSDNLKSVAFRITMSAEGGLTEDIINQKITLILCNLAQKHQAQLRQ